jgi:vacuolar-type H+-ATPase subunit I/STV1
VFTTASRNDDSNPDDFSKVAVNLRGNIYEEPQVAGARDTEGGTPIEQAIKQLQEQIEQTQKTLLQQQQQLAVAQSSKAPEQEKAQKVMAIEQQISGTMAQLNSLLGALMELMKDSVNITA